MSIALQDRFVSDLPELAVRWQAESAPEPRLLVLNTLLAGELGLDPDWLRGPGMGLLLGSDVPEGAAPAAQAYAYSAWIVMSHLPNGHHSQGRA